MLTTRLKEVRLEEIYRNSHLVVKDTAYKILKDYHLAEDICHDIFLKLSDEWIEQDLPMEEVTRYLRMMAYSKAIDVFRAKRKHPEFPCTDTMEELAGKVNVCEQLERTLDDRALLTKMLQKLKEHNESWYKILLKVDIYHIPANLAARELGIDMNSLSCRLYRAREWVVEMHREEYNELKR